MVAIPPILIGALVDAVVTGVSKVLDTRLNKGTVVRDRRGRGAPSRRSGHDDPERRFVSNPDGHRVPPHDRGPGIEAIRDLESRIHRAMVVQAVGIVGMVAGLLWVFG